MVVHTSRCTVSTILLDLEIMHSVICTSIEMSTTGHSVMNPRVVRMYVQRGFSFCCCCVISSILAQSQQRDWSIVVRANYTITDQNVAEVTGTGSRANGDQVRLNKCTDTYKCTLTHAHVYTHTRVNTHAHMNTCFTHAHTH